MDIHWEDPPDDALFKHENRGGKYIDYAIALRAKPGEWAVLPPEAAKTRGSATGLAQSIRNGSTKGFKPKGAYDAFADIRKDDQDVETYKVYVRYLGEPSSLEPDPEAEKPGTSTDGNGRSDDDQPGNGSKAPMREWARQNGWPDIGNHGRLPDGVLDAYEHAKAREGDQD